MEKTVDFADWEIKALLNTKKGECPAWPVDAGKPFIWQARRVIEGVPVGIQGIYPRTRTLWQAGTLSFSCQWDPGDVVGVREELKEGEGGGVVYSVDGKPVEDTLHQGNFEKFRMWEFPGDTLPPASMPVWACREWIKVRSVGAERIGDLRGVDLLYSGLFLPGPWETAAQEEAAYLALVRRLWPGNLWTWVLKFQRV